MISEGVVQFAFDYVRSSVATEPQARALCRWRRELFERDAIGCDLRRYGACYGNVSVRTGPWAAGPGRREFLVSCTQTGGVCDAGPETLCRVLAYDHERNHVTAQGPCRPSSETMTHGAMYDASLTVRAIVHGHAPTLWSWLLEQGAPATAPGVDYGTPEMAREARRIVRSAAQRPWRLPGLLAMTGHQDGVIAWGTTPAEATARFLAGWHAMSA